MKHPLILIACCCTVAPLAACEGVSCLQGAFPAITVQVVTEADGGPILGATGEVLDQAYRDNLQENGGGSYSAAEERPGTYAVHVERAGYSSWDTTGVRVRETGGPCSMVVTENLQAQLSSTQPAPLTTSEPER
jgi:hypothetical protein